MLIREFFVVLASLAFFQIPLHALKNRFWLIFKGLHYVPSIWKKAKETKTERRTLPAASEWTK